MRLRLLIEMAPIAAALLLAWVFRGIPAGLGAIPTRILRVLAPTGRRAILSSALVTLAVCAVLSWVRPTRSGIHDQFAYLLTADTFAHGRLTNPTHPLWQHFESFHVIHKPSYQAKYPPAQGLWMAAGQVLTGHPIVGVWLSMAAAAAAVCWMLLAWAPPRWALLGGLMPAIRFGTGPFWDFIWFAYWSTTYWGGAVALLGGALMFGAIPRLMRRTSARDGAVFGAGLVVLANSRPYEGALAGLAAAALLGGWLLKHGDVWRPFILRAIPAAACILGAGVLAMGYYNYRVTGDPLRPPYMVHSEQYEITSMLVFRPLKPDKVYNHKVIRDFHYGYMLDAYNKKRQGFGIDAANLAELPEFFLGYALMPALLFLPWKRWSPWFTFAIAVIALLVVSNYFVATMRLHFHYLAPGVPWILFLVIAGLRQARVLRLRGRRLGRVAVEAMLVSCVFTLVVASVVHAAYNPRGLLPVAMYRPEIENKLLSIGKKDLVVVHYEPNHDPRWEWVYNGADLDGAPIVWARDMGPDKNRELLDYYSDRRIWMLYADRQPPELVPLDNR